MNMIQPDPAGLFEPIRKKQQQSSYPAADLSVIAQLQNRPAPADSLPVVNAAPAPDPQPAPSARPVSNNPLVALSQSGQLQALLKAKAEQLANQPPPENPLVKLAANGGIRKLVMAKEDQQYNQALARWKQNNQVKPLPGLGYPKQPVPLPKPQPPARDWNQIEQDWNRGVDVLRPNEFSNLLNLVETGQMTPEQEAKLTQHLEPRLNDEGRQYLQTSRMTRDRFLTIKSEYDAQMAQQANLREKAKTGSALDWEAARQTTTPGQAEQFRGAVRGITFDYAFAPDEERLNSDNPEIVADERAKRHFYLNEQSEYPISSMVGNMIGATATWIPAIGAYRYGRMAHTLKAGPPTQAAANLVARGGAPATMPGMIAEGSGAGFASGLVRRPQGAEDMTLQENLKARVEQAGMEAAFSAVGDVALTKGVQLLTRSVSWAGGKVSGYVNDAVETHKKKGLDKTARKLGYKDFDEFADAATEIVTDETGSRIRLKSDILNGLSEADQALASDLLNRLNSEANNVPGTPPVIPAEPPISRAAQDRPDETQFPVLKSDTEQGGSIIQEPAAPTTATEAGIAGAPGTGRSAAGEAETVVPGGSESTIDKSLTEADPVVAAVTASQEFGLVGKKGGSPYSSAKGAQEAIAFMVNSKKLEGNIPDYLPVEVEGGWKIAKTIPEKDIVPGVRYPLEGSKIDITEPYQGEPVQIESTFRSTLEHDYPDKNNIFNKGMAWIQNHVNNLKDKFVFNGETGHKIEFEIAKLKHTLQRAVGGKRENSNLLETIPYTAELVQKGKYRGWAKEVKGKKDVKRLHYYETVINMDGKPVSVWITVLEKNNGKFYYDTAIKKDMAKTPTGKAASDGEIIRLPPHRDFQPRHSIKNANQDDGAEASLSNLSDGKSLDNPVQRTESTDLLPSKTEISSSPVKREPHHTQPSLKTEPASKGETADIRGTEPPKEPPTTPPGTSLYSTPIIPAARQVANMLHLNPGGAVSGAVYGGIAAGDASEAERYSPQWWLDSVFGAAGGAVAGSAGFAAAKGVKIKGKTLFGERSWGDQAIKFMGEKIGKIPGLGIGDKDIAPLKKQQKLLKALIERQAEKAGQYLLDNFTPSERAAMADLIEQRGIIAEGNLLHRQAQELDDFIAYTATKMQDLGMLDDTIEPGGYLHRYYAKDLGITGLMRGLTPGGKTMSGSWSRRRGTQEVFDRRYMSQSMRDTLDEVQNLIIERDGLKKQAGDLVGADTQGRIDEINDQLKTLQSIEFREYTAIENGKLKSFFLHPDEVPVIPGLQPGGRTGLPEPIRQGTLEGMEQPRTIGNTGQLALTDRRWTLDGKQGEQGGILHRDWTKAERESWGEIHDAAYRMVRGQAEVAHDLSLGIFYKQVVDRFTGTKVSDTEMPKWKKVPNTSVGNSRLKKYGALAGKYVTPEVWAAVKHHGRNPLLNWTNNHPAVKNYLNLLGKWKAYKTVYNPVSHMNNVVSNLGMYYMSDYSPKHLGSAIKELYQGENSALYREARDNGLFGTDFTTTLNMETGQKKLDELLEKLRNQAEVPDLNETLDTLMSIKQWFIESKNAVAGANGPWQTGLELAAAIGNPMVNTAKKPINAAANFMQKAYQLEDEFFKMAVYMAERQKGTKPFDAVKAANKYFFDYSEMPTAFQVIRDSPWGSPFISYTYYALPALARTAVEKPEKLFAFAAFLEGINYAGMAINGELQDQGYWDQMAEDEEVLPTWMQGRSLFGGLNNITPPFVDSYKLGLANMLPAGNPFMGNAEREGAWPAALSFFGPDPAGSNPIMRLLFDLARNRDWRDAQIYNPNSGSNAEKVRKSLNYVYQNITPSNPLFPGSYSQQKIIEGAANEVRLAEQQGEQPNFLLESIVDMANATAETLGGGQYTGLDRRENEILFRDALWGAIGIKRRPIRIDQFVDSKLYELNKKREGLSKWIAKHEKDYAEGRLTTGQIEQYQQQFEAKITEFDKKADLIEAAR